MTIDKKTPIKILVTNNYDAEPYNIVKDCTPKGFELVSLNIDDFSLLSDVEYILAGGRTKIDKELLDNMKSLKMIQRTGVGLDSLDLCYLKANNIPLYINQGVNAQSVAEHTVLLILASLRRLINIHQNTINGVWIKQQQGIQTSELKGKTVGLIGLGHIGFSTAKILNAFDANLLYFDVKRLSIEEEQRYNLKYCSLDELLSLSDIISMHCPLTEHTRHMINKETMLKMKDGVVFVNTARGKLVRTDDLIEAINSGKIAFAALDVHEEEPLISGNNISKCKNVILTPHIGGITYDSFYDMMDKAMNNISKFENGCLDEIDEYKFKF